MLVFGSHLMKHVQYLKNNSSINQLCFRVFLFFFTFNILLIFIKKTAAGPQQRQSVSLQCHAVTWTDKLMSMSRQLHGFTPVQVTAKRLSTNTLNWSLPVLSERFLNKPSLSAYEMLILIIVLLKQI